VSPRFKQGDTANHPLMQFVAKAQDGRKLKEVAGPTENREQNIRANEEDQSRRNGFRFSGK
jgi:hypothetical protein